MSEFKIRADLPKATVLNRSLLIVLCAIVGFLLLWALISAFQPSKPKDKPFTINGRATVAVSPLFKDLPKNYQDVNGIKKYLTPDQQIPAAVTDELNKLRAQESALQAQLAQLQSHPVASVSNMVDPATDAARKSDLFFASGKPPQSQDQNLSKVNNNYNNMQPNTPYAQQNMQGQKLNFLQDTTTQGDVYNHYKMMSPVSPYEVQSGTILAANLLTAINTSLPGDIIAQVRQDVYDTVSGQYLLIPKGSKLLGKYDASVAYGQERVLIAFDRIIRPDGTSIQLSNFTGSDEKGSSGFVGDVDNHWSKILGAATISTMLSFGAGVAADHNTNGNMYYPGAQQSGITGAANSVSQTGQTITNRAIDIQPTLTVPAGFNFNVIVNKDMVLQPYADKTL